MLRPGDPLPHFRRHPVFGRDVDTEALTERRPLALAFLRSVAFDRTRETIVDLLGVWDDLDRAGVALVAVVQGTLRGARDFVPRHHVRFPVVHDPEGELYAAYDIGRDRIPLGALAGVGPSAARTLAYAAGPARGLGHGVMGQRCASFAVAPGGRVAWAWYATSSAQRPDAEALRDAALALAD